MRGSTAALVVFSSAVPANPTLAHPRRPTS
jgi:hypothetical protein